MVERNTETFIKILKDRIKLFLKNQKRIKKKKKKEGKRKRNDNLRIASVRINWDLTFCLSKQKIDKKVDETTAEENHKISIFNSSLLRKRDPQKIGSFYYSVLIEYNKIFEYYEMETLDLEKNPIHFMEFICIKVNTNHVLGINKLLREEGYDFSEKID